jgi:hypothetical protein
MNDRRARTALEQALHPEVPKKAPAKKKAGAKKKSAGAKKKAAGAKKKTTTAKRRRKSAPRPDFIVWMVARIRSSPIAPGWRA